MCIQDYYVVLLSPSELDPTMKLILQVPIWAARVIYIQGSALKDSDLSRCRSVRPELSMGWDDPWVGSSFFWWVGLDWVHYSKSTKNLKGLF